MGEKLNSWIQLLTMLAVVVGLGLVIWELEQTREIAKVQQISDKMSRYSQRLQAMMGEESARALAKACGDPDSLDLEDMIVLNAYYTEVVNTIRIALQLNQISEELSGADWAWDDTFARLFATEYGRYYFKSGVFEPQIQEAGNRFLAAYDVRKCSAILEGYSSRERDDYSLAH